MKKASPAQIAARKLFAERAKAGTLRKKKRAQNPRKKAHTKNPIVKKKKTIRKKNPATAQRAHKTKYRIMTMQEGERVWYVGEGYWAVGRHAGAIWEDLPAVKKLAKRIAEKEKIQVAVDTEEK